MMSRTTHLLPALLRRAAWFALALTIAFIPALAFGGRSESPLRTPEQSVISFASAAPEITEEIAPPEVLAPLPRAWAAAPQLKTTARPAPEISAAHALILDEASLNVLFDKEAHQGVAPASLTKIATLILGLEHGRLDDMVDIDIDFNTMRGSTVMGLLPGDRFSLRDLLYGLMLPSGNDAALAIGKHISGSDQAFVRQMNLLLHRFGLTESQFANPHGLSGPPNHYASAYDLAVLARYGMSLPHFKDIVSAPIWKANGSRELEYANINSFLFSYPGADGIKTGYTRRAGPTLVASAVRDGNRLYVVVLNAPMRDLDAIRLLNWAFASYEWPPRS